MPMPCAGNSRCTAGEWDADSWLVPVPKFKESLGAAVEFDAAPNERPAFCPASEPENALASIPPTPPGLPCMPMLMLVISGVVCMYPPDIPDACGGIPSRP